MSKPKRSRSAATTVRVTKKSQRRSPAPGDGAAGERRRPWMWIAVTGVVVAVLVGLVVVSSTRSGPQNSAGSGAAAPSGGGNVGGRVTPIKLTSLAGRSVSVPTAGRPGALFFTVSSCASCISSAQALSTLKSRHGSRVDVLMVDIDPSDPPQNLRAWGNAVGNPAYPLAIDTTGNLVNHYQVQALGTTVIYDARGRIVDRLIEPSMGQLTDAFRKAGIT